MSRIHYEIIKANRYYKNKAPGWVALVNGQPHHMQTKTEAFEFVVHLQNLSRTGGLNETTNTRLTPIPTD
jgi:hypothetical protein